MDISTTNEKGAVLEEVVEKLHRFPGVRIEKNVRIKEKQVSGRDREFDLILTVESMPGYIQKYYIECKNFRKPVGIEKIEAFLGKLTAIGASYNEGVFVSALGFKKGVAKRAVERGIKIWEVNGLDKSGFAEIAGKTYSNRLIVIPVVHQVCRLDGKQVLSIFNKDGAVVNTIQNVIYQKWINKEIKPELGRITITIDQPGCDDSVIVDIDVIGALVSSEGHYKKYTLVDPVTKQENRVHVDATFLLDSKYRVETFLTEDELTEYVNNRNGFHLFRERCLAPRIQFFHMYYPLSQKAVDRLKQLNESGDVISLETVEGNDLSALWDKIAEKL